MPRSIINFFIAAAVAWTVGILLRMTLAHGIGIMIVLAIPVAFAAWALLARERWWIIVPIAFTFGGKVYVGFRLFSYELAMVLAAAAVLPLFLLQKLRTMTRPRVPFSTWILLGYLLVHGIYSIMLERQAHGSGAGNILRVYFNGMWPLIFAIAFTLYGSTRSLRLCLACMFVAALLRSVLGLLGYYFPYLIYGHVFRFFMPTADAVGADLRHASLFLVTLSLAYLADPTTRVRTRWFHALLLPAYIPLVLIGGSRVALGGVLVTLAVWLLIKRHVSLVLASMAAFVMMTTTLNVNPDLLYGMPYRFRRTLSVLVIKRQTTDIHRPVSGSDRWHFLLGRMGLENWTENPATFFFGNRVYAFDEVFLDQSASWRSRAEIASKMGYYESGLWTILAVLGLGGAVLYLVTTAGLLRKPFSRLLRGPPRDTADAFAFIAVAGIINWLVFCWIAGHFPSGEIMFAAIARAAYDDRERDALEDESEA